MDKLTTTSVSRENYLALKKLGSAEDYFNDVLTKRLKKKGMTQILSDLANRSKSVGGPA